MRAFTAAAVVGLASLPSVIAWGAKGAFPPPWHDLSEPETQLGHEIVATIAQSHVAPKTLNTICSILGDEVRANGDAPCYLADVANWADKVRLHAR